MRLRLLTSAAVAMSIAATPALANPAARLSIANAAPVAGSVRAGSTLQGKSKLAPGAWAAIVGALAIGAGAIILAVDDGDDDAESA
jgi:hypothetical protein